MRIAMFSWEAVHGVAVSGVSTHVSELARALAARDHEVHVFTRRAEGQSEDETVRGVQYHRPSFELLPNLVDEVQGMCRAFVERLAAVEEAAGPVDILHAHDWTTCNAGVWALEDRAAPLVLTLHSIEYARIGHHDLAEDQRRVADHEHNGANHAARVIAVSHSLRRDIMECLGVEEWRSETVYNGVDLDRFDGFVDPGEVKSRCGLGPLDPLLLYTGPMEYRYGPDLLVEAMALVRRTHPDARAVLAGDGPMREDLERRSHERGLEDAIRFLEAPDREARADLVRAAEAVVVPSRYNPFGVEVLEAWAAGRPVVATQDGGPGEYVWHDVNGVHVHTDPDSLAWGIGHLFRDVEWARWVGRNGRAAAETAFTWERAAAHTEEVYDRARETQRNPA